jgi:Holliday junction resolvase RusA-like endonuclease
MSKLHILIPCLPISGNEYKVPNWKLRQFFVTKEAKAFKESIGWLVQGQEPLTGKRLKATIVVYLGKGDRLDAGNVEKCILDALQQHKAIGNDSRIKELHVYMERDWEYPRTVIDVEELL